MPSNADLTQMLFLAFTGPLASGRTTIAEYLRNKHGFVYIRLSDLLRNLLNSEGNNNPTDEELQNRGDALRKSDGPDALIKLAINNLEFQTQDNKVVFDGIKNPVEVMYLRRYPQFFLISVDASFDVRLERYRRKKSNISDVDFKALDERDSGKNQPIYGQNVTDCVDQADVQIINEDTWAGNLNIRAKFDAKVDTLIRLINRPGFRSPTMREIGMHHAYSSSLLSNCLKRKVGATITKSIPHDKELVVALGYNRTPDGLESCKDRYGDCYRDQQKAKIVDFLRAKIANDCNGIDAEKIIQELLSNHGLKRLDFCQAVHAEESAILQVAMIGGTSLQGTTLYTTTFPCLLCAKKIIQTGISRVIYNEAYPVQEARQILKERLGPESIIRFEGVKSSAFFKLFSENRLT